MEKESWLKLVSEILIAIGEALKDLSKEGMKEVR